MSSLLGCPVFQCIVFFQFSSQSKTKSTTKSCEILFSFKLRPKYSAEAAEAESSVDLELCRDVVVFHKQQAACRSLYEIPPPNYNPSLSREKLL
jgi:hypothetical protein